MYRLKTAAIIILTSLLLGGCGEGKVQNNNTETGDISSTVIEIQKDGSILETMTEGFGHYNEEKLKNMILSEAADYNSGPGAGNISVDKYENKAGIMTVQIKYASAQVYTEYNTDAYNDRSVFLGTVAEADDKGLFSEVSLTDIKRDREISKEELLGMGDSRILIAEMPMEARLPGKILYTGENVAVEGKNHVVMQAGDNGESLGDYYVVFK